MLLISQIFKVCIFEVTLIVDTHDLTLERDLAQLDIQDKQKIYQTSHFGSELKPKKLES